MAALRVLFMVLLLPAACVSSHLLPTPDAVTLLAFKSACAGPAAAALASWTESTDPCSGKWRGVTCQEDPASSSSAPPRVRRVVLESLHLVGDAAVVAVLAGLPLLSFLSLGNNSFTGSLRAVDFSPLAPHLKLLYLSSNGFSGRFPESILRLRHLRRLDLSGNSLTGTIPPEIGHRLGVILTLLLARNAFVGPVPASVEAMAKLAELDVSGNHLEGQIPEHLAAAFPASSFAGNQDLCGAPLQRRCSGQPERVHAGGGSNGEMPQVIMTGRRKNHDRWMVVVIMAAVGAAVTLTLIAAAVCAALWFKKQESTAMRPRASSPSQEETVRFDGCCVEFDVRTLMMGAAEMLGKSAAATTYRVVMGGGGDDVNEAVVVVKRLRRRRRQDHDEERRRKELARAMGTWRHDNIVNLRAFYASPEELLLVVDYVPNGSLHSLLHENRGPARVPLEWPTRLKLAEDAARGLAYLHGVSVPGSGLRLSHRHLTSSNILVDAAGNARVSDFALLELVAPAPLAEAEEEWRRQKEDVHCFGVILLEILTGRSPEDMPRWVQEEWTSEVLDVELQRSGGAEEEMVTLLQVALLCVGDEAAERPRMAVVWRMIEDIRERGSRRSKFNSASPSHSDESSSESPCVSEDTASTS